MSDHNYIGHNCIGHNYVGDNCIGHKYVGHNYVGGEPPCEAEHMWQARAFLPSEGVLCFPFFVFPMMIAQALPWGECDKKLGGCSGYGL